MKTSGTILQIGAWLVFIAGLVGAGSALSVRSDTAFPLAVAYVLSGVVAGAFLFGIGNTLFFIEDMAVDARLAREANERSATALETLIQRRRETATSKEPVK